MNYWVAIPTFIATLAWLMVVVWYWIRAKWWKSPVGRNTMGISIAIALALVRLTYSQLDAISPAPMPWYLTAFGSVIYSYLAYSGFRRVYLIEQSQRQKAVDVINGVPHRRWDDPKQVR